MKASDRDRGVAVLGLGCFVLLGVVFGWLVIDALQGAVVVGPGFLVGGSSEDPGSAGIVPALFGSIAVVSVAAAISIPLGVASAIYLEEFCPSGWYANVLEMNAVALAAVPSVIWGVLASWVWLRAFGESILSGGLTLGLLMVPIVMVASRESLRQVPTGVREAALALGTTRGRAIFNVVIPTALPGILTAIVLAVSRAMGEAAPLLLVGAVITAGSGSPPSASYSVIPVQVYDWLLRSDAGFGPNARAGVLVLLAATLGLNALFLWGRFNQNRRTWN